MSAIRAFKESYVTAGLDDSENTDFGDFGARRLRYSLLWAQYENTSYRAVHHWAASLKHQYGLYRYARNLYSPAFRLGEFYRTHVFGGQLSGDAGPDGAIPIIVAENERLRPAIAELWRWSNWAVNKDVLALWGAVLGDVAIQITDDVTRGRVYLSVLHPGLIKDVELDPFSNVKSYTIEEVRPDPTGKNRTVTYTETVGRDGDLVTYETYLNGQPHAWSENTDRTGEPVSSWAEGYGFIPLTLIRHNDVGAGQWGWSELHPARSKMQEVDDLASNLSDQIRKYLDPVWLMKGMKATGITVSGAAATTDRPEPGREEIQAMWTTSTDADAQAMVADLNLEQALAHLAGILKELEKDYPELDSDISTSSGDASGRALRVARQRAANKVLQRRSNYDSALVRAQQMALSIGGFRGYKGYEGFNLDSYQRGDLDHEIGNRPVFESDPLDEYEIETEFWRAAEQAQKAGCPLAIYLKRAGWSDDEIAETLSGNTTTE